jgi:hypothetical protein
MRIKIDTTATMPSGVNKSRRRKTGSFVFMARAKSRIYLRQRFFPTAGKNFPTEFRLQDFPAYFV